MIDNRKFYQKSIKEHGISAQGVHWNSKYTQYKRFEIFTKLIKKDIKDSIVIDAGCGFAEYYNYLQNNHKIPKRYIGIDIFEDMVDISSKRYPFLEFYTLDILEDELIYGDYYLCSGAMNLLHKDKLFYFIHRCYTHSAKGFIFNYLQSLTFVDISKEEIISYCKTLCDNIKIKDDYLDNDFTVYMKKRLD